MEETRGISNLLALSGIGVAVINAGMGFILAGILRRLERLENYIMFGEMDLKERRSHAR